MGGRESACCSSRSTPRASADSSSTESARQSSPVPRPPASMGYRQSTERVTVGGALRHFGDKFQSSKVLDGQRYWRIPVMEGEFLVQETFGVQKAIGGGNFLILAKDQRNGTGGCRSRGRRHAEGARRRASLSRRHRACRQQGGREEIQEHDRVDQRRVLSDACAGAAASRARYRLRRTRCSRSWSTGWIAPRSKMRCEPASRRRVVPV